MSRLPLRIALASVAVWLGLPLSASAGDDGYVVLWAEDPVSNTAGAPLGPDVITTGLPGVFNYGSQDPGDGDPIAAFAVGTTSCNIGDAILKWDDLPDVTHPVIRQNMFRLNGGRLEQIGTSWVKHGFFAVNQDGCGGGCINPNNSNGASPFELRPNCSDPYSAGLNGNRTYLGPTSDVNAFTGDFPPERSILPPSGTSGIPNRLQVRHSDLDPSLNAGAVYYVEGHYIHLEDAFFGNSADNASHRRASIIPFECPNPPICICGHPFCVSVASGSTTQVGEPAIRAWKNADPGVRETDARVPGEGIFILAAKATDLSNGFWRYEYALYNMDSHRSAGSFLVPMPEDAIVQNVGFHDVHHHSGEPWKTDDWGVTIGADFIEWATTPYDVDPEANALRWSTLYNFRFEVNAPPGDSAVEVELFRPGFPDAIAIRTDGPQLEFIDCNDNDIADLCDVGCTQLGCDPKTCGQSLDCNDNGVPDECETDCNGNGIPDECDIRDCPPGDLACGDCNENTVPDGCETDCDGDGIPDTCEETLDQDADGFEDCEDLCPLNTPPGACEPPALVTCRFSNGSCLFDYPRNDCLALGGTPMCGEPPQERCQFGFPCPDSKCREGCIIGDWDLDGDVDMIDAAAFQQCFSRDVAEPAFVAPPVECQVRFDTEDDGDVDLLDAKAFTGVLGNL